MKFVYVVPGSFQMGSSMMRGEEPIHPVTISKAYWIGKYEVTQNEYLTIMGNNPSNYVNSNKPVEKINWNDAVLFCKKITQSERIAGRLPSGYEYRLPTEAEWEFAARGGVSAMGNKFSGNDDINRVSWYKDNAANTTQEVGRKSANELGIHDMSGNVSEWCLDDWHNSYDDSKLGLWSMIAKIFSTDSRLAAPSDGSRWGDGTSASRVIRGGNIGATEDCCKNTFRNNMLRYTTYREIGFRVVIAPIIELDATKDKITTSTKIINSQNPAQCPIQGKDWGVPNLGMKFVYVEPGSFMMGSNDGIGTEKPVHRVTISKHYWIGKYEVTQDEYQAITGNNPSKFKGGKKPVETVSWDEAVGFCQKLTDRERVSGQLPANYEYRLPTEAEWEFAEHGGNRSKGYQYSGSNNLDSVAWYKSNSESSTHDVGTKSPNELGIYDMSGNVWEMCMDYFHDNYDGAPSDGSSWSYGTRSNGGSFMNGTRYFRVIRGWAFMYQRTKMPRRSGCLIDRKIQNMGFRVVIAPTIELDATKDKVATTTTINNSKESTELPVPQKDWVVPNLDMKFVYVDPGSFMMGSNDLQNLDKPIHRVTISRGYWLGKYEVTQDEYQAVTGNNPSTNNGGKKPVETVTWDEAVGFCQKLTEGERTSGRLPANYEYRLPTEAEWEFAARGGNRSRGYKFSGSNNLDSVAWYESNSENSPHEVGTKSPNELGIYDMSGNVLEWCLDDWHGDYNGAPSDGSRWGDGTSSTRMSRGGGCRNNSNTCRATTRIEVAYSSLDDRRPGRGFRVVIAPVIALVVTK